jgi:hypothetical protein
MISIFGEFSFFLFGFRKIAYPRHAKNIHRDRSQGHALSLENSRH